MREWLITMVGIHKTHKTVIFIIIALIITGKDSIL